MDQKTIISIVVFFAILVGGMFGYAFLKKNEIKTEEPVEQTQLEPEVEYASITRIDGKHYFIDGVHTVVGEIPMPTPCDLLEASSVVEAGTPKTIVLNFNVINNAEFCAQTITPQRYKVTAEAPADANFRAMFMGRQVELNLIPAEPGETPEDFELFIKG